MIRVLLMLSIWLGLANVGMAPLRAADTGRFIDLPAVTSAHMPTTGVTIWLPPGYDRSQRRYGVVYMHDAQNLFFPERSNFNKIWAADKAALRLVTARRMAPFIIVGINQPGDARFAQYLPQALYEAASPALRSRLDAMAKRRVYSDDYLRFLVTELKPMVDRRYRTMADRDHTAIVGSSMGGLVSCYAFTRYPDIFGRAACVSTHWPMGIPDQTAAFRDEIIALWAAEFGRGLGTPSRRRLWMDHGDQTLDAYYPPYQREITTTVSKLGWRLDENFVTRAYPGAAHDETAWAARLEEIFGWLLKGWQ